MPTLYEILGVSKDASSEEIKEAFRNLSKRHHPDMPEGDNDSFVEIKTAYDVLHSPERRKAYDETGRYDGETSRKPTMKEYMNQILSEIINKAFNHPEMFKDVEYADYKKIIQKMTRDNLRECQGQKDIIKKYIDSTKIVIDRLGNTKESKELLSILKKRLNDLEVDFRHIRFIYLSLKRISKFVGRVDYTPDQKPDILDDGERINYANLRW